MSGLRRLRLVKLRCMSSRRTLLSLQSAARYKLLNWAGSLPTSCLTTGAVISILRTRKTSRMLSTGFWGILWTSTWERATLKATKQKVEWVALLCPLGQTGPGSDWRDMKNIFCDISAFRCRKKTPMRQTLEWVHNFSSKKLVTKSG